MSTPELIDSDDEDEEDEVDEKEMHRGLSSELISLFRTRWVMIRGGRRYGCCSNARPIEGIFKEQRSPPPSCCLVIFISQFCYLITTKCRPPLNKVAVFCMCNYSFSIYLYIMYMYI